MANIGEGISRETLNDDPWLVLRRTELIVSSARRLADLSMIDFDPDGKIFIIKDVGRIAAKYYIRHKSIEVFRTLFKAQMTEADTLDMLSKSTEVCHCLQRCADHDTGGGSVPVRPDPDQRIGD